MTEHEARDTPLPGKIDITVPHSARIWNYWLGGKDNYTVDRVAGDAFREIYPARHGFAVPDNPTYDEAAQARHWDALARLYQAKLAGG